METNRDFRDLFRCFNDAGVRYLVVGAYAVMFHTEPRYTRDLDIWVEPSPDNAARVLDALARFGAPVANLTADDLCNKELVYQVGVEPNRFDVLMAVKGLDFAAAWERRVSSSYAGEPIAVLGLTDTIRAKQAAARPQDLLDVERLEAARAKPR